METDRILLLNLVRLSLTRKFLTIASNAILISLLGSRLLVASTLHVPGQYPTIQAGIDASANADTVLVAPGIYSGSGNEEIRFLGKKIVLTSEAGAPATTLLTTNPVRTLIFDHHEDSVTVIDGFTITGGFDSTFTWTNPYRGGIIIDSAGPVIRNCTITGCFAANGGGIDIKSGSTPRIINCTIYRNFANALGGGVRSYSSGVEFRACRITGNRAAGRNGGGMVVAGKIRLVNCYVGQNKVGGVSTIIPTGYGGGICGLFSTDLTVDSCKVVQNSGQMGGGIAVIEGTLAMNQCLIYNNVARDKYAGVLVDVYGPSDVEGLSVSHCTFSCNYAALVGADGVAVRGFAQSHADISDDDLPRAFSESAASTGFFEVSNSILAFSSSAAIGQFGEAVPVACSYNDVWKVVAGPNYGGSLADQTGANGNICGDPLFCSVSDSGFTIDQASPCVGAGTIGSNIGAYGIACNNYGSRMPTRIVVPSPTDPHAARDSIAVALSSALPWDTLYFPSTFYQWLNNIEIDKPLYLLGKGQDSTTLLVDYQFHPIGLTLREFCVIEKLHISALDMSQDQYATGILCQSSPIIFDCTLVAGGYMILPYGIALDATSGSPYIASCWLGYDLFGLLARLNGKLDLIAPNNFWRGLTDSMQINMQILDSRMVGGVFVGTVIYAPFLVHSPTAVSDSASGQIPTTILLEQNYPNPFNLSTIIAYYLPKPSFVNITVFNSLGQVVCQLVNEQLPAGQHTVVWSGIGRIGLPVASGVYFYRLNAGEFIDTKKMVLLK